MNAAIFKELHILLVEDDLADQKIIAKTLEKNNDCKVNIQFAGLLSEALEYVKREQPDVILLDLNLPDSKGMDTVHEVRRAAPLAPVVVLTGQADEDAAISAVESGVQDYLDKNMINTKMLMRVIRYAIERVRTQNELHTAYAQLEKTTQRIVRTEKMSAIGVLAAGIAHELNNPMMGVLNFIQYGIKHTEKESKVFSVLQDAEHEIKRCIEIVKSLLTLSHSEDSDEENQHTSCVEIMERVLRLMNYRAKKENVTIKRVYGEDIPEILTQANSIQQVFLNIISNAFDALKTVEKKEIEVDIRLEGNSVRIGITDTGIGIEKENMSRIFNPFYTTKTVGEGTGLGLSLSDGIIRRLGGRLVCASKPGVGTTFAITLPCGSHGEEGHE